MPVDSHEGASVDTSALRAAAESGTAALRELHDILQSTKELVAASGEYWTGQSADHFREWLSRGLADYERCLDDMASYPRELVSYADEYEGVITQTARIAEGLGEVSWDEPA